MEVTVIIPSYNHERFISESIKSVLGQKGVVFELIVIDDGSQDKSREIIQELALRHGFQFLAKENEGLCATLNKGIALSKGKYLIFFASDDVMPDGRLKEQLGFFENNPSVDVVGGSMVYINEKGETIGVKHPPIVGEIGFDSMLRRNSLYAPTVMIRRDVFNNCGLYNESYVIEDYYYWLKALRSGCVIYNTQKIWAFYRMDDANYEKKFNWYFKGYLQVLEDYKDYRIVPRLIARIKVTFSVKMALILGRDAIEKYKEIISSLPFTFFWVVKIISVLPQRVRNYLLKKII